MNELHDLCSHNKKHYYERALREDTTIKDRIGDLNKQVVVLINTSNRKKSPEPEQTRAMD